MLTPSVPPAVPFSRLTLYFLAQILGESQKQVGDRDYAHDLSIMQVQGVLQSAGVEPPPYSGLAPFDRALCASFDQANLTVSGREALGQLILVASDPNLYYQRDSTRALSVLNNRLRQDGLLIRPDEHGCPVLAAVPRLGNGMKDAVAIARKLGFDSVADNLERGERFAEADPEDAVTAARAAVESICKCVLDEFCVAYDPTCDLPDLLRTTAEILRLDPKRTDIPVEIQETVRRLLGALQALPTAVGELRNRCGDSHGKGLSRIQPDARLARLTVSAAQCITLFWLETFLRVRQL